MTYTTVWVRPGALDFHYAGPYGTEDGSNYANAIPGLKNVPWATESLQVIVSGQHVKRWDGTGGGVANHGSLPILSGTSDEPVIVRGDASSLNASAEDGTIIGGMIDENSSAWTVYSGDTWVRTVSGFSFPGEVRWCLRVTGSEASLDDYVIVPPVASLSECTSTEDTFYVPDTGANPWTIYAHMPAGVNPNTKFILEGYGYTFALPDRSHIIFYGLSFGIFNTGAGTFLEYRRCKIRFGEVLVEPTGDKPGYVVDRCHLQHAGVGAIYLFSVESPQAMSNNCRVTSTEIYDVGKEWFNEELSDAHAIATRHGIDQLYIDGCKTERTGHAIVCYNYPAFDCKNTTVKRTVCRAVHTHYGPANNWNGIALNPADSHNSSAWAGFETTSNRVERCYVQADNMNEVIRNGMVVDDPQNYKVLNCQVDGGQTGIALPNISATNNRVSVGYLRGNVLRGQTLNFISSYANTTSRKDYARAGKVDSDNNTFIQVASDPPNDFWFGQNETFAQWKAESSYFDPNSTLV